MLVGEAAWKNNFDIAVSIFSNFCFNSFSLSPAWSAVASPPFFHLSLPPRILCPSDFVKSLATARKSYEKILDIVKNVYGDMTFKRTQI